MLKILNWLVKLFSNGEFVVCSKERINNLYECVDYLIEIAETNIRIMKSEGLIDNSDEIILQYRHIKEVYTERWKV